MNKKVQRRQARVRHARREEVLQAGRQWSLEEAVPEPEAGKSLRGPEGATKPPAKRGDRNLR